MLVQFFSISILICVFHSNFAIPTSQALTCKSIVETDHRLAKQIYHHGLIDWLVISFVVAHACNFYNLLTFVFTCYPRKKNELYKNRALLCIELSSVKLINIFDKSVLKTKIIESYMINSLDKLKQLNRYMWKISYIIFRLLIRDIHLITSW